MSDNGFARAADVVARSGLVRTAGRTIDVLRRAARRSAAYRLAHDLRGALGTPPAAERVRLAGVRTSRSPVRKPGEMSAFPSMRARIRAGVGA